jgi:hypothetical protein
MPFERNLRGDTQSPNDNLADVLARGIGEVLGKTTRLDVCRYRARRKDPQPVLEDVTVRFDKETENVEHLALALARELLDIAENDADGRRVKYRFRAMMAAPTMREREVELWGMDAVIDPSDSDERDAAPSRDSEAVRLMERSGDLMGRTGDHYVKLLDKCNGLVGMVTTALDRLSETMSKQGDGEWKFRIEQLRMRMETAQFVTTERAEAQRAHDWHETLRTLGDKYAPIIEALLTGKGGAPSEREIATIFASQPDLRDLALRFTREKDPQTKGNIRAEITARWSDLSDDAKAVIVAEVQAMPEDRVLLLALWLKGAGFVA